MNYFDNSGLKCATLKTHIITHATLPYGTQIALRYVFIFFKVSHKMWGHNYVVARDAQTFLGKWKYTLWKQSIPHSPGSLIWYFWCGFHRKKKSLNCDKQPHPAQIVVPDLMGHRSAVFHKVAETATAIKQRVGLALFVLGLLFFIV